MRNVGCGLLFIFLTCNSFAQVDTAYVYNNGASYGLLDIRIAKSAADYYYLDEGKTFSYRENGGVRTNTFLDMTSWDSSPYTEGSLREKTPKNDLFVMNYRLLFPQEYKANYALGYPLIVM